MGMSAFTTVIPTRVGVLKHDFFIKRPSLNSRDLIEGFKLEIRVVVVLSASSMKRSGGNPIKRNLVLIKV